MTCKECEKEIADGQAVIYDEDFIVCKTCEIETAEGWEADKKMLAEQGIAVPCDFFERLEGEGV